MRRTLGFVALLSTLAMLAFPGQARASGGWFTQGSGTVVNSAQFSPPAIETWQWVARSDVGSPATGAPARGHFSMRITGTGISFDADVTCLNVSGNTARIGIAVTDSTNPFRPAGSHTWITMTSIGHGFDALHLVGADGNNSVPPVCPLPSGARDPFDGTIEIREEASPYSWLAQGSGYISFLPAVQWQWIALSDVGGGNARGHFTQRDSSNGTGWSADVACLQVNATGTTARVGLIITQSTNPSYPAGRGTYIHTTIVGEPPDETYQLLPDATYPAVDPITFQPLGCPAPVVGGYPFEGEMNVRNGPD
jgi:hypothetical protein